MDRGAWGEFELIARLAARLGPQAAAGVTGIGDDAAAIPFEGGYLLLTCDAAVEGRHFHRGRTPMADVGWKVASASASDVAACGGQPAHALISLAVPQGLAAEELEGVYDGLAQAAAHYGFLVLGGNVTGAAELMVDCFMTGRASRFVARSGARPGDILAVSGTLGDSDAGGTLLGADPNGVRERHLLQRHLRPVARTDLAEFLAREATAAIDISDSLAAELHHLARAGGVRLEVGQEKIPLSPELVAFCRARGEEPLQRALFGGEDYQLLCALPPEQAGAAQVAGFTVIGQVAAGSGVFLSGRPLPGKGWDHLRAQE